MRIRFDLLALCYLFSAEAIADDITSVLYYPDSITFTSEQLVQLRDGIFYLKGNSLVPIEKEGKKYNISPIIKEKEIDEIITTDIGEIIKSGENIYLQNKAATKLLTFDKEDFKVFPYQKDNFFISYKENEVNYLCKANLQYSQTKKILELHDSIVSIASNEGKLFVITENNVFLFEKGKCINLLSAWEPFRYSVLTSSGLLIGTDNSISLVTDVETFIPLIRVGCKKMLYYRDFLYIYTPDNAMLKINFKEFEQATDIRNKAQYFLPPSKVMIELR